MSRRGTAMGGIGARARGAAEGGRMPGPTRRMTEATMPDRGPDLFDKVRLPPEVDAHLRELNPWWQGLPGRVLPPYRRWVFATMLRRLDAKVAPAIVLRGARQVASMTLP